MIRRLVCYCYTTGYNDEPYDDENDPPPYLAAPAYINRLYLNAEMYGTAEKYDIPSLKEKAVNKFDAAIRDIILCNRMDPQAGFSVVDAMIEAIPHIYSSTPDGERRLRDRAIRIVLSHKREVLVHKNLEELIAAVPEFFEEPRIKSSGLASRIDRILRLNPIK